MSWFNAYGLGFMAIIMIPNVIFAAKCQNGFVNLWQNKTVETLEQIGRFGCFALMAFNIPYTYGGFWFDGALTVYLAVNAGLAALYCLFWGLLFKKNSLFRALVLSILPSLIFLFSGIMLASVPLIVAALIFAPCHILLSCRNALLAAQTKK